MHLFEPNHDIFFTKAVPEVVVLPQPNMYL